MAEARDGSHILAVHVGVGWRGQATMALMDLRLLKVLCSTLTTLPFIHDCGTRSYGCGCVAPAAQQHGVY